MDATGYREPQRSSYIIQTPHRALTSSASLPTLPGSAFVYPSTPVPSPSISCFCKCTCSGISQTPSNRNDGSTSAYHRILSSRKRSKTDTSNQENEDPNLVTPSKRRRVDDSIKPKPKYTKRRDDSTEMEDILNVIKAANWTIGEFLDRLLGTDLSRSQVHAGIVQSFVGGRNSIGVGRIISHLEHSPDGRHDRDSPLNYSTNTPYSEIFPARPALHSYVACENHQHVHRNKSGLARTCSEDSEKIDTIEELANALNLDIMGLVRQFFGQNLPAEGVACRTTKYEVFWRFVEWFFGVHGLIDASLIKICKSHERECGASILHVKLLLPKSKGTV